MDRVGAPFDEKRKETSLVVVEIEGLPSEESAVGTFALAGRGPVEADPCIAETGRQAVEVAGMRGPANKVRRSELLQAVGVGRAWLGRIRSDDFEIVPFAEGKQGVARAAPRMDAAQNGGDPGMFIDESDALVEVAGAQQNVVEHSGHLNRSPGRARRGECAPGQSEKQSAR